MSAAVAIHLLEIPLIYLILAVLMGIRDMTLAAMTALFGSPSSLGNYVLATLTPSPSASLLTVFHRREVRIDGLAVR